MKTMKRRPFDLSSLSRLGEELRDRELLSYSADLNNPRELVQSYENHEMPPV